MRIWVSNTAEDQIWQGNGINVESFDFSSNLEPTYRVKIEARLLDDDDDLDKDGDADETGDADRMEEDGQTDTKSKTNTKPPKNSAPGHPFRVASSTQCFLDVASYRYAVRVYKLTRHPGS